MARAELPGRYRALLVEWTGFEPAFNLTQWDFYGLRLVHILKSTTPYGALPRLILLLDIRFDNGLISR